jgi:hypothetical protein
MTILFVGTSLSDVSETAGNPQTNTTASQKDIDVQEGILCGLGGNTFGITFAEQSELWVSFYMNWQGSAGGASLGVGFFKSGTELFRFNGQGNSALGALSYNNGSTVVTDAVVGGDHNALHRVDIHIKMADTGGIFRTYRDGVLDADLSGVTEDTLRTTAAGINRILFRPFSLSNTTYSAIVVATEDTRAFKLVQQLPTGAGASAQWAGNYTAIDETGIGDTDSISTGMIGDVSTFAYGAIPSDYNSAAWQVKAVAAGMRAVATPEGEIDVAGVVRTNNTNYQSAALNVGPTYSGKQTIWETNPNTGAAWNYTDASASQVGVKAVAG